MAPVLAGIGDPGGYGKSLLIAGFGLERVLAIPARPDTFVTTLCPRYAARGRGRRDADRRNAGSES